MRRIVRIKSRAQSNEPSAAEKAIAALIETRLAAVEKAVATGLEGVAAPIEARQAAAEAALTAGLEGIAATVEARVGKTLAPVSGQLEEISAKSNIAEKLDAVLAQLAELIKRLDSVIKVNERLGVDSRVFARQDKAIDELSGRLDAVERKAGTKTAEPKTIKDKAAK